MSGKRLKAGGLSLKAGGWSLEGQGWWLEAGGAGGSRLETVQPLAQKTASWCRQFWPQKHDPNLRHIILPLEFRFPICEQDLSAVLECSFSNDRLTLKQGVLYIFVSLFPRTLHVLLQVYLRRWHNWFISCISQEDIGI
jgi:hypothetical protein